MTRVTLLLAAILAASFALATPSLALNPQPLPPGIHAPVGVHGFSAFVASRRSSFYPCRLAMCRR
jgi:hypothetical protein